MPGRTAVGYLDSCLPGPGQAAKGERLPDTSARTADDVAPSADASPVLDRPVTTRAPARRRGVPGPAGREWILACLGGLLLAVAMIWILPPFVLWLASAGAIPHDIANPLRTIIGDAGDPTGQAWLLAWDGHAFQHDLGNLWNTNAFFPDKNGLAFNDTLLGYAPAGLIGSGPAAAMLRYNIVFVLAFALASIGGYALSRQLGANRVGAAIAGATFAYAPWHYGHDGHLNILSSGGIALSLAMLARGHGWSLTHGYRRERTRPGWALAGWLVAAWQITLGFGIGLPFFYVLVLVCVVAGIGWLTSGRPGLGRRLILFDLGGGVVFALVSAYFANAYTQVRDLHPETLRAWDYVAVFSPPPRGLLVAPRTSLPWGTWHDAARTALGDASTEKVLFCGVVLYTLAVFGLFLSVWKPYTRMLLGAGVLLGMLFALGTNGPLYRVLYDYLPGFDGSRTPGRLILWPNLLLGILAAGFVTALARTLARFALRDHVRLVARVVTVPLLLLALFEGLPKMDHVEIPAEPAAMAAAQGPLIVLPTDEGIDLNIQLWSTDRFPLMVNGTSSLLTPGQQAIRELMKSFPSADSVNQLRSIGIRSVVVLRDRVPGTPYEHALDVAPPGLGITRSDVGPDVLYTIS
jgi:hypothetical protein